MTQTVRGMSVFHIHKGIGHCVQQQHIPRLANVRDRGGNAQIGDIAEGCCNLEKRIANITLCFYISKFLIWQELAPCSIVIAGCPSFIEPVSPLVCIKTILSKNFFGKELNCGTRLRCLILWCKKTAHFFFNFIAVIIL